MEHFIEVDDTYRLWVRESGDADGTPLLLVMGANAAGITWPDQLVERLGERHRVIVYDHRDTGRSTWAFDEQPYAIRDLATDAVAVLDALDIDQAHVVGMSLGGLLVQLLLVDHPDRLRSATIFGTAALGSGLVDADDLPGPDPRLLALWAEMDEPRDAEADLAWRVEHWRLLNGDQLDVDPEVFRDLEERINQHSGRTDSPTAHALADQSGLERGAQLVTNQVPTLVIEAPADPINPPPHAAHLTAAIGRASMVTIPRMGHALPPAVLEPLGQAILAQTASVDRSQERHPGSSRRDRSG